MSEMRVLILKEGTSRSRGREAQRSNIMAAKVLAESARLTICAKGMDKMLVAGMGDIVITNDGATIMKEMDVQNPAAKMLVEVAKAQDSEVGDGTTTAVVLAGELLAGAEALLDKDIHPNVIIDGYRDAAEKAQEILDKIAVNIKPDDQERLRQIAITSLNTKGIFGSQTRFADLAVDAVRQVMEKREGKVTADIDLIKVMKKHGQSLDESELVNGIIIDKEVAQADMPKRVTGGGILLLNAKLESQKTETSAKINIDRPEDMFSFIAEEENLLEKMAEDVAKTGAKVLFTEKNVDDQILSILAKKGILTVKNVSSGDMEKLAKATGGSVIGTLKDLSKEALGQAKLVEEVKVGEDKLVFVRDCKNPKAVTIMIRGGSEHVEDGRHVETESRRTTASEEAGHQVSSRGGNNAPQGRRCNRLKRNGRRWTVRNAPRNAAGRHGHGLGESNQPFLYFQKRLVAPTPGIDPVLMKTDEDQR